MKNRLMAVIFDMDGLLIDSEPLWSAARNEVLKEFNETYSLGDKKLMMGRDYNWGLEYLIKRSNLPITVEEFKAREKLVLDKLFATDLELMPHVGEFIKKVDAAGLKKAIATSSPKSRLKSAKHKVGLVNFDIEVTGDDIEKGKPDPEIFLKTSQKLNINPENCVVLEDSPFGIEAARRGNMRSIAVCDTRFSSADDFTNEREADLFVYSLHDLNIDKIETLFG